MIVENSSDNNIVVIGTGKLAQHLTKRLLTVGLPLVQIVNRTLPSAIELTVDLNSMFPSILKKVDYAVLSDIKPDARWYILAVSDDAIDSVAAQLASKIAPDSLVCHVSGATPSVVLSPYFSNYGVFYPLQSFSIGVRPAWTKIPICVYTNKPEDLIFLKKIVRKVSQKTYEINDDQRATLHLSAVFVNNFVNHIYTIAEELTAQKKVPFELLHPLMEETVRKALLQSPALVQTGPAMRGDQATMQRHLQALQDHPIWQDLYEKISSDIENRTIKPS